MDQLIEGVLAVGAGLAPDDRPGRVVDALAVAPDGFAVALHVALLEIGREAVKMLVVRQHGMARRAEEIVVPDPDQAEQRRGCSRPAGAVRKCSSIAKAPSSNSSKRSKPTASAIGKPMADQSE